MKTFLGKVCSKIGSGATPTGGKNAYSTSGTALIRSQNVLDFCFSESGLVFINEVQAKKLDSVAVKNGDVLLNITGDSVARCCLVPSFILPARVNQHVSILRADENVLNNIYMMYFLQWKKDFLLLMASSGATRNAITKKMIENIEIDLPKLEAQNKIASILHSLDKKIQYNTQINRNLEQQAQAIFKSWFVDFEPFQDGKFVDSECGPVPDGWRVGILKEMLDIRYGKDHKKLSEGKIPVYGSGGLMRLVDKALYSGESVLIPRKGTLNNVMRVSGDFWTVDTMFYSVPKHKGAAKFAFHILHNMDLASMNSGSAVPSMTTDILNSIDIVVPPQNVLDSFDETTKALWELHESNLHESSRLATLRDTLLPKLMSGEIDVSEVAV